MKTKFFPILALMAALAIPPEALSAKPRKGGGGKRPAAAKVARPKAPAARPAAAKRPVAKAQRPASRRPVARSAPRPVQPRVRAAAPQRRAVARSPVQRRAPSPAVTNRVQRPKPQVNVRRNPAVQRPAQNISRVQRPQPRIDVRPNRPAPSVVTRPPVTAQPDRPAVPRPDITRPAPQRPIAQPAPSAPRVDRSPRAPDLRNRLPGRIDRDGPRKNDRVADRPPTGARPDRPETVRPRVPGAVNRDRPDRGDRRVTDRPRTLPGRDASPGIRPQLPTVPGLDVNRPDRDERDRRVTNRPRPERPRQVNRPERPRRDERWDRNRRDYAERWAKWNERRQAERARESRQDRAARWNRLAAQRRSANWARAYQTAAYYNWRKEVVEYRRDRAEEIWERSRDRYDHVFDDHWWRYASWNRRPHVDVVVNASPWWWWRPATWGAVTAFYGTSLASEPVIYDPGTTVVYEGDTVYVQGEPAGSAVEYRQQAAVLANPAIEEIPVPEPVAEGQPAEWLPLGVWAFTQQQGGDAVMFFQLSADKDGIVSGAYKNVLTGDEEPIVGQLDTKTQRLAWHVGDNKETVYETSLPSLTSDVASVFVHMGQEQTQTWLLVRLPSPEMPPSAVQLPPVAQR